MPDPSPIQTKFEKAFACHRQGKLSLAQALYDEVLAIDPNHVDALHLAGVTAAQVNDHHRAIELIDKAIALDPDHEAFHFNRGIALNELKEFGAAASSFSKAFDIKPDYGEAYLNCGNALCRLNKHEEAVDCYDKAIAIKPDDLEAYYCRSIALQQLGLNEQAIASFDQVIALKPDLAEAFTNRGNALQELRKFEEALASFDSAIAIKPGFAENHYNRGNALRKLGRFESAIESYGKAVAINPGYHEAYHNMGMTHHELNQLDAAITCFDKAIAINPGYHEARLHKSLALLLCGNLMQGWALYESRWQVDRLASARRNFNRPPWLGDHSLAGKTILLHSEQGLGDTIQFCRYVPLVADLGARVILEAEPTLCPLLKGLEGVSGLVARGDTLPDVDFHCPLLSLPLAFRTNLDSIPHPQQYLKSDPVKLAFWKTRLGQNRSPRVGLVWSGSVTHTNDDHRSIPLSTVIQALPAGFTYVSLQKELRDEDRNTLGSNPAILHFGDELKDFTDTAALCGVMDVVISVDTSVAHLSGALGRPTWMLLPFSPDWRWMLDRDDSPWYPSMRLFRQQRPNDWMGVFEKLSHALLNVCKPL
ncbi:MAG: tetratricopeptide repeat protein [Chlorobiaceae bacterium]|nr:tetratricopeptide repeat protein [Chlorobiaceae bacterium]